MCNLSDSNTDGNILGFHRENDENGFLSNWYLSRFEDSKDGKRFTSVEQWLMYKKAITFNDTEIADHIMHEIRPDVIKKLGRQVRGYNESQWASIRFNVLLDGLRLKFSQSEELKRKLLYTGDKHLVEFAANDLVYGVGVSDGDPGRFNTSNWRGQNLLGLALMQVRDELKEGEL